MTVILCKVSRLFTCCKQFCIVLLNNKHTAYKKSPTHKQHIKQQKCSTHNRNRCKQFRRLQRISKIVKHRVEFQNDVLRHRQSSPQEKDNSYASKLQSRQGSNRVCVLISVAKQITSREVPWPSKKSHCPL